jgi:hypothetical protein
MKTFVSILLVAVLTSGVACTDDSHAADATPSIYGEWVTDPFDTQIAFLPDGRFFAHIGTGGFPPSEHEHVAEGRYQIVPPAYEHADSAVEITHLFGMLTRDPGVAGEGVDTDDGDYPSFITGRWVRIPEDQRDAAWNWRGDGTYAFRHEPDYMLLADRMTDLEMELERIR